MLSETREKSVFHAMKHFWFPAIAAAVFLSFTAQSGLGAGSAAPDFHKDVAPLLRDYCLGCHNEREQEGGLSLETHAAMMRGGESGPSIKPGEAARSFLVRTVTREEKPAMPPRKEPQPSAAEVEILKAWVNAGALGPEPGRDVSLLAELAVPLIAARAAAGQPVSALAVSPDGSQLVVARFGVAVLMDAATRQPAREFAGHSGKVNSAAFSPDGKLLLTSSGVAGLRGQAVIWDAATGDKVREFGEGSRDIFYDAEFSPDGALVATAGYDRAVTIWDAATGERLRHLEVHNGAVFDLAFSPDGNVLASASADGTIKLWSVADGERLDTLSQPQGEQYSVCFTRDGRRIIAAGADNRIRVWRLVSTDKPSINPLLEARFAHEGDIVRLAITRDGRQLVSSGADLSVKFWSLPDLTPLTVIDGQPDIAAALAPGADGAVWIGRLDGSLARVESPAPVRPGAGSITATSSAPAFVENPGAIEPVEIIESEPNNGPATAQEVALPALIKGMIQQPGDSDVFRFHASAGAEWVFEVRAATDGSPLDSRLEILHTDGSPVRQTRLQAVRDSWFTFRGKDSDTVDDFRLHNWEEMDLNDYLYANGEVTRLWLYPRGPDSGFKVYPGAGQRHTFFNSSAISHPLGGPAYIVRPVAPDQELIPNGLPVFDLFFDNDDDPLRELGKDSRLTFTAPGTGDYLLRVTDVRGQGGPGYSYQVRARPRAPNFEIRPVAAELTVPAGSGQEFPVEVRRIDGFEGEIRIEIEGLPTGFHFASPLLIEAGQRSAMALIHADATAPPQAAGSLVARAILGGKEVARPVTGLGKLKLGPPAKAVIEVLADGDAGVPQTGDDGLLELSLTPGQTITAMLRVARAEGFTAEIPFGKEDAGRNLPFGVFVDHIGLNGLLLPEGVNERRFFITAGPDWLPETTRLFHLRAQIPGNPASQPVRLRIVPAGKVAER
jgi:hypothetical protein